MAKTTSDYSSLPAVENARNCGMYLFDKDKNTHKIKCRSSRAMHRVWSTRIRKSHDRWSHVEYENALYAEHLEKKAMNNCYRESDRTRKLFCSVEEKLHTKEGTEENSRICEPWSERMMTTAPSMVGKSTFTLLRSLDVTTSFCSNVDKALLFNDAFRNTRYSIASLCRIWWHPRKLHQSLGKSRLLANWHDYHHARSKGAILCEKSWIKHHDSCDHVVTQCNAKNRN